MNEEELYQTYLKLECLQEEFIKKWRLGKNELKYETKVAENNKRVSEIVKEFVKIIKEYDFLYQCVLENEFVDYNDNKNYMELTGFWDTKQFYGYSSKAIRRLKNEL